MFRDRGVVKFFSDRFDLKRSFFIGEFFKNYTWGGTFSERDENNCAW